MKKTTDTALTITADYRQFIEELKARVATARVSAARKINHELILLYWDIGRGIVEKQQALGWGESVVEMVAADLRQAFPSMSGFSPRNVWYMRRLYEACSAPEFLAQVVREMGKRGANPILPQPVAELEKAKIWPQAVAKIGGGVEPGQFLQQLVAEIPWGHHRFILDKLTAPAARLWYLRATARFGWSRNVLLNQIKAGAYERAVTEKKTHNFDLALPESLPRRGFILQPRVGPLTGLPWVTIDHPHNPAGVVSPAHRYATIVVCRLSPSGVFDQRPPTVPDGSNLTRRDARLFGRCFQNLGLPTHHRRRRRGSCSSPLPDGPHHHTIRLGEGNQTGVQPLDQTARSRIGFLCVAGRIRCVLGECLGPETDKPLHHYSGGASQEAHFPGRISDAPAKIRRRMGRTLRVGLRTQPRRGCSVHSNRIPRVAAWPQPWAGGRNPVGIEIALDVTTHERGPEDQPSIGIILCAKKDDVEVEYALRSKANPIGVAAYELQSKLPGELKGKLPTAKQLADVVRGEMVGGI